MRKSVLLKVVEQVQRNCHLGCRLLRQWEQEAILHHARRREAPDLAVPAADPEPEAFLPLLSLSALGRTFSCLLLSVVLGRSEKLGVTRALILLSI